MNFAALTLVLAFVWASVTGDFSLLNLMLGAGIALVALWVIREHVTTPNYF